MEKLLPLERNLRELRSTVPSMRYNGEIPFDKWQAKAYDKLWELVGMNMFKKVEDNFTIEFEKDEEDFHEIRFVFQSEQDYYVPCHLWLPRGVKKPYSLMICLQGHSTGMHISMGRKKEGFNVTLPIVGDRDFACRVVKEGMAALIVEQRNFGECGGKPEGPDCFISTMTALLMGRTTIGERVWDISRAIDVIENHFPDIDKNDIMCMGNSGGGTATFYIACLEKRIKAAMPSCSVCSYDYSIAAMHHCSCNFIPNVRKYFDMGDLAGLIAPRALVVVAGAEDPIFPLQPTKETFEIIKKMYSYSNKPANCRLVIGDEGHRFYADPAWKELKTLI